MRPLPVIVGELPGHGSYLPAVQVTTPGRLLFISGQVPERADGTVPDGFADQCRLAWQNVFTALRAADMGMENLAKVTVFLSDRRYREQNASIRNELLGDRLVALTVVISEIFDERWLLEIEAVASA